jgi:phosphopantetheine adenylyltransferase
VIKVKKKLYRDIQEVYIMKQNIESFISSLVLLELYNHKMEIQLTPYFYNDKLHTVYRIQYFLFLSKF